MAKKNKKASGSKKTSTQSKYQFGKLKKIDISRIKVYGVIFAPGGGGPAGF